jgi:hypothetical protein
MYKIDTNLPAYMEVLAPPRAPQAVNVGRLVLMAAGREGGAMATKEKALDKMVKRVKRRSIAIFASGNINVPVFCGVIIIVMCTKHESRGNCNLWVE